METNEGTRGGVAEIEILTTVRWCGWWGAVKVDGVDEYLYGPARTSADAMENGESWLRQRAAEDPRVAAALARRELRRAAEWPAFVDGAVL